VVCLAGGYLAASDSPSPDVQLSAVQEQAGFHIQNTSLGVFLVDSRTGDTWKWYANLDAGRIGWQYFARPSRIHTCSMDAELPECRVEPDIRGLEVMTLIPPDPSE